jgi:O-succinylbenzoate synthase
MKGLALKEAVALVKEHLGKNLRVDCNRAWSLDEALEFASHFQASDFEYLEEPTKSVEELISFSKKTGFPIALDESIHTDWTQIPTLKAIVVKPTVVGFIPRVPPHLKLILSSGHESGLGLVHIANLAKPKWPVGLDTVFEDDLLIDPIRLSAGFFEWEKSEPILDFGKLCPVL